MANANHCLWLMVGYQQKEEDMREKKSEKIFKNKQN